MARVVPGTAFRECVLKRRHACTLMGTLVYSRAADFVSGFFMEGSRDVAISLHGASRGLVGCFWGWNAAF